jgi:hypothetical protein
MIALMELMEADGLTAAGGLKPDRKRDQSESDVTFPNTRHSIPPVTDIRSDREDRQAKDRARFGRWVSAEVILAVSAGSLLRASLGTKND